MNHKRISPQQLAAAKSIGTLEYLQRYEPDELTTTYHANGRLMHCKAGKFRTRTHDSLEIDGDRFYWWSRREGGVSALDYLIKVKEMTFREAVYALTGGEEFVPPQTPVQPKSYVPVEKKPFVLPERNENSRRVFAYLSKTRGIDSEVISHCMHQHLIYEDKQHHNCVFVGHGDDGKTPKFASVRSTLTDSKWRMDQPGSDKAFSFRMESPDSDRAVVFEAPIDAMSFASLMKQQGKDWKAMNYVALSGVAEHGLLHFLDTHQNIRHVTIALDGDQPGRSAAKKLKQKVQAVYPEVRVNLVWPSAAQGKDWNEVLLYKQQKEKSRNSKDLAGQINQAQNTAQGRNESVRESPASIQQSRGNESPAL